MKTFAPSQVVQANFFHKAKSILDMEKAELEVEIEVLLADNQTLRDRVAALGHALSVSPSDRQRNKRQ